MGLLAPARRDGRYYEAIGFGKLCDTEYFCKAFERLSMVVGYVEESAVSLPEAKYSQLVLCL